MITPHGHGTDGQHHQPRWLQQSAHARAGSLRRSILSLTAEDTQQCAHIKQSDLDLLQSMEVIFKSQACLNGSFLLSNDEHFDCSARNYGLDLKAAEVAFDHLRSVENESIKQVLMPYNADLDVILKVMNVLFIINNSRKERVSYQIFYWPELDWYANVKQEFVKWIMGTPNEFSICNFSFLFDASAKTSMLQADQVV
ncbi:GL16694 [Drosophila persimilis]|uniref:GL16694 n=1 Tax=Drosophila persimilis TaxID=7234 RepID=B4ISB8_DROPE|nr:GL16694 [Drosophila persimilis]